jgi:hypothetical protein
MWPGLVTGRSQNPKTTAAYSSPSSAPWLDVGAPPSIDGTPAGGVAFAAALDAAAGGFPADRGAAFFTGLLAAARLAGFFAGFRFAGFFAVFAAFFVVFVFFPALFFAFFAPFFAAISGPSWVEVSEMTYMVTYVRCQSEKLTASVRYSIANLGGLSLTLPMPIDTVAALLVI